MNFQKIVPHELKPVTVTVQALDNQWVPGRLLKRMLDDNLGAAAVEKERQRHVRVEFVRSLVNAESVVAAHNSYLNDEVVGKFLDREHPEHAAFRTLLSNGTIVPFLFTASSPEIPVEKEKGGVEFTHDQEQRENWNRLCREADNVHCLRLDWDDERCKVKLRKRMTEAFHHRITSLAARDCFSLAKAFQLQESREEPLRRQLAKVATQCTQQYGETGKHITREQIYASHVVADGTAPRDRKYDGAKPFAAMLKQMVDLVYTTNLSNAVGRYPLTPGDSPARSVLQEETFASPEEEANGDDLLRLFKALEFDVIQRDLFLHSYEHLTLEDVVELRSDADRPVWRPYIDSVASVLGSGKLDDPDGIAAIYRRYADLAQHAGTVAAQRYGEKARSNWEPKVKVVLEVSGMVVLEVFWPGGKELIYSVAKDLALDRLSELAAPTVARMVVSGREFLFGDPVHDEVANSVVFWQGRMSNAGAQLEELRQKLAKDPKFGEARRELPAGTTTTIDEHE